jgi:hypothetical protein
MICPILSSVVRRVVGRIRRVGLEQGSGAPTGALLPSQSVGDKLDGSVSHAEFSSQRDVRSVLPGGRANLGHLFRGQFGVGALFSPQGWRRQLAASLGSHVVHVVGLSPNEQMGGPDTWRIVAAMENKHVGRDGTVKQFVGKPMRKYDILWAAESHHCAVFPFPVFVGESASPQPAAVKAWRVKYASKETFHRQPPSRLGLPHAAHSTHLPVVAGPFDLVDLPAIVVQGNRASVGRNH